MRASDVVASASTRKKLGPSIGVICGWLWPGDCQTCGEPLKGQPSLCVDDYGEFAVAALHHPRCRAAAWNESAGAPVGPGANLSWTSRTWADLPLIKGAARSEPRPLVMVNPGLEMVFLRRSDDDGWEPEILKSFTAAGLRPAGEVHVDRPVPGLAASLVGGRVAVQFRIPPFETYTSPVDDAFTARAHDAGGLLFGVTHLVNPARDVTGDQMNMLMLTGTLHLGWVGLA